MKAITREQRKAIYRLWSRMVEKETLGSYRAFRRTVQTSFDCLMVRWCDMWVGIEEDGYTHS
jgi:hypothetical protein